MKPNRGTMTDAQARIAIRGASGHLYGWLDPSTWTLEVKRKGGTTERIDLRTLLGTRRRP